MKSRFVRAYPLVHRIAIWVVAFSTLVAVIFGQPAKVYAAACSGTNVTLARVSSSVFYVDSGFQYRYIGYSITTSSSKSYSDLYVTIDSFSATGGAALGLAETEDGTFHVGSLGTSSTAYVYFYIKSSTTGNNTNQQNYTLNLFNGSPTGNTADCTSAQNNSTIESDGFANANKVTSVTYTAPYLGSTFTMTVTGDTGTIGSGKIFSYSPASDNTWNGDCLELRDTSIVLSGGNTGTYNHLLGLTSTQLTATSTTHYVLTYTFMAKCVAASTTPVKPLGYISSGSAPKHTDNSSFTSLPPIAPAVNSLILTNSVSPAASTSGGTTTYSVDITNSGPSSSSLDNIVNTLASSPANASYVSSSATYDDDISGGASASSIADPTTSGQVLTWTRTFTVPSGKTGRLTFQATIPSTVGSYVNSVIGHAGSSQVDKTVDTTDNSPATSQYGVGSINMAASTKTASDINGGSLQPGDIIEYTITAMNSGTSDATGVHISDTLDTNTNNLSNVVIGDDATNCGNTYADNSTSTALDITGVSVTHGTSCIVTFRATVKSTTAAGTTILNSASIVPSNAGAISGSPSSTPMVVHKDPILTVTNTENDADNVVTANQVITYTVTITNTGQSDGNGIDLTGTITGPVGSMSSRTITNCGSSSTYVDTSAGTSINIAALAVTTANPCVISYTMTVNSGATSGSITNSVDATAAREGGNDPAAVSASTLLIGVAATPPSLAVNVSEDDTDGFVTPGQSVVYTTTITNSGQTDATTSLASSIPSGMGTPGTRTYTNCGSPGSSYSAGTLTVSSISIAAANTCTISFTEAVNSPQDEGATLTLGVNVAQASQGGNDPANVNATTLTVDATPVLSLAFAENDADNTVSPNQDITYTATISNTGDGAATVVLLSDAPSGAISSPSNFSFTNCGSSYSNNSSSSVSVAGLEIQVGTPCVVTYHVTVNSNATGGSSITNSGDISAASEGGNNPIPVAADALTVASLPSLAVTSAQNDGDNSVVPGQDVTYTVTINNSGGGNATGVSLSDPVSGPVGSVNTVGFTGCGSSHTNSSSGSTLSVGSLAITAGGSCVVTFHVVVNANATAGLTITDSADASAATEGGNNPNATSAATLTVATVPNLSAALTDNDADNIVTPGQTIQFTLTISNTGNGTASTSATVAIPTTVGTPSSVNFTNCGSAGSSFATHTLTLSSLSVTTASNCIVTFNEVVVSPNTENALFSLSADVAQASQGGNDPNSVNSSTFTVDVTPSFSTSTFAQVDNNGGTLVAGDTLAYTLTIKNTGDGPATGVSLSSVINTYTTFNPSSVGYSNCGSSYTDTSTSSTLQVSGLQIAVSTDCVITFSATLNSDTANAASISDTATIGAAAEGGSGASVTTNTIHVDATPSLAVTFVDNDADNVVTPGQTVQYQLTITNSGTGFGITSAQMVIPAGMGSPSSISYQHCTSPGDSFAGSTLTITNLKVTTNNACVVTFNSAVNASVTEGQTMTATADVAAATEGGNNPTAVAADQLTANITPQLSVGLVDDDTDNIVGLGQAVNSTIAITNSGDGTATGIGLSYALSTPGTSLGSITTSDCGTDAQENHTNNSLTFTGLTATTSTPCEVQLTFTVDPNAANAATITQSVDVAAASEGGNNPSPVSAAALTVDRSNAAPNTPSSVNSALLSGNHRLNLSGLVGATLSANLSDPNAGDQVRYRIQFATDASFSDIVIDYQSTYGSQGSRTYTYQQTGGTYLVGSSTTILTDGAYYIRLRAEDDDAASSAWYVVPSVAFTYDNTAPNTPSAPFVVGDVGDSSVTVGWDATTDSHPDSTIPYRLEVSDKPNFNTFIDLDTSDLTAFFDSIVAPTHKYFRLYIRDAAGNVSDPSDVLDVFFAPQNANQQSNTADANNANDVSKKHPSSRAAGPQALTAPTITLAPIPPRAAATPPPAAASQNASTTTVIIFVRDSAGHPLKNVKVTLHSQPRVSYTDTNGEAIFTNVPIGNHTAVVDYNGESSTAPITLKDGVQELHMTLTLKQDDTVWWNWWWLWLLFVILIYTAWKYYRHRKDIEKKKRGTFIRKAGQET